MVKPVRGCINCIVTCPLLTAFVSIAIPVLFMISTIGYLDLSLEASTWGDPNDERTLRDLAFNAAQENIEKSDVAIDQQSVSTYPLMLIYEALDEDSNIFDVENLKLINELEKKIISQKNYSYHCVLVANGTQCSDVLSLLPDLTTNQKTEEPDEPYEYPLFQYGEDVKEQSQVDSELTSLYNISTMQFGKNFDTEKAEGRYYRSIFYSGLPLEGYKNEYDNTTDQNSNYEEWTGEIISIVKEYIEEGKFNIYYGGTVYVILDELYSMLNHDYMMLAFSFVYVLVYLWVMTKSGFLAAWGMFHIVLSMPLALLIYNSVFSVKFFSSVNPAAMYIIFAIGADDIFIFINTWNHSRLAGPDVIKSLKTRMMWTYPKASKAMFITSVTTAWAFFLTALSPIVDISVFGIFAASLVIVNYLFVITWFPAILILYEKYYSHHHCCCSCAFPRKIPGGFLPYESEQNICCAQCGTACHCSCCNCFKTKHKLDVDWGNVDGDKDSNSNSDDTKNRKNRKKKKKKKKLQRDSNSEQDQELNSSSESFENADNNNKGGQDELFQSLLQDEHGEFSVTKLKFLDRFLYAKLSPFLSHRIIKWVLVIIFTVLTIVMITQVASIEPATESSQSFPDWSNTEKFTSSLVNDFESNDVNAAIVYLYWGLDSFDMTGVNTHHPEETGTLVYDKKFDLTPAKNQEYFITVCDDAFAEEGLVDPEYTQCLMKDFKTWVGEENFPVEDDGNNELANLMKNFTNSQDGFKYVQYIDYSEDSGEIRFIATPFQIPLTIESNLAHSKIQTEYDKWYDFWGDVNKNAPDGMDKSMFSADGMFVWMRSQEIFVESAIFGAIASVIVALFVITVATRNLIIGALSFITISSIVVSTIGLMKVMGWELGVIESVAITVLAGLTVDYVVHLAHAYHEYQAKTREKKMQGAMYLVGSSVISGFITTLGSSLPLLSCYLITMFKFGIFMIISLGLSFLYAFFFFMPLLAICGPRNHTDLREGNFCRKNKKKKNKNAFSLDSDSIESENSLQNSSDDIELSNEGEEERIEEKRVKKKEKKVEKEKENKKLASSSSSSSPLSSSSSSSSTDIASIASSNNLENQLHQKIDDDL